MTFSSQAGSTTATSFKRALSPTTKMIRILFLCSLAAFVSCKPYSQPQPQPQMIDLGTFQQGQGAQQAVQDALAKLRAQGVNVQDVQVRQQLGPCDLPGSCGQGLPPQYQKVPYVGGPDSLPDFLRPRPGGNGGGLPPTVQIVGGPDSLPPFLRNPQGPCSAPGSCGQGLAPEYSRPGQNGGGIQPQVQTFEIPVGAGGEQQAVQEALAKLRAQGVNVQDVQVRRA